jgi:hypothetical protein
VLCTDAINLFTLRALKKENLGTKGSLRVALDLNGIAARTFHISLANSVTIFSKKRKHRTSELTRNSAISQASLSTEQREYFRKLST